MSAARQERRNRPGAGQITHHPNPESRNGRPGPLRTDATLVEKMDRKEGSWVRPGGVVIERTFAEALGVRVGDKLTLNDQRFADAGIAVTAAQSPYPNLCADGAGGCGITMRYPSPTFGLGPRKVGLMWTTEADAIGLASSSNSPDISS